MLIELLKQHEIIVYGYYELILENQESIFAYTRTLGNEKLLVINNFFEKETFFMLPEHIDYLSKELLISNYIMEPDQDIYNISLRPYELLAIKLFV